MVSLAIALLLATSQIGADRLQGTIRNEEGEPVAGANVFIAETLEGVLTNAEGAFDLKAGTPNATIVIQMIGYRQHRQRITLPRAPSLDIVLQREAVAIDPLSVRAGGYEISDQRGASLSSLEVVQIPGARGDVARAFQTLPGVQTVDEGTGLFVRGGAAQETRVILNGAAILTPQRLETPTGSVAPSVDPFLLQGMFFSTGGFSVRHGNALSAIADLQTVGLPARARSSTNISLAGLSGRSSLPLGSNSGLHLTGNVNDTRYMFELNGSTRVYTEPPHGHTFSASGIMKYRPAAELKLFAIRQASDLGVLVEDAALRDSYRTRNRTHIAVVSWKDMLGSVSANASGSYSSVTRTERLGIMDIEAAQNAAQMFGEVRAGIGTMSWRAGSDVEYLDAKHVGVLPVRRADRGAGAAGRRIAAGTTGTRHGLFTELELPVGQAVRITPGVRTDYSTQSGERTYDPRIAASVALGLTTTVVASAGIYHQIADPLMLALTPRTLAPMTARQLIVGIQSGADATLLRAEAYVKRYRDLVQLTRDHTVVPAGRGRATGLDIFKRIDLPGKLDGRVVYSYIDSERTDPHTSTLSRSEYDVTHSVFAMLQREWQERWRLGISYRGATGRPHTPVHSAAYDSTYARWEPIYGPPYSERLPAFHRVDLSASLLHWFTPTRLGVFYVSLSNLFDRRNIQSISYSDDYSIRQEVPSQSKRSVFFGASFSF